MYTPDIILPTPHTVKNTIIYLVYTPDIILPTPHTVKYSITKPCTVLYNKVLGDLSSSYCNVYIQNYSGDKVNNMTSMVLEQSKQSFQNQKYKDFKLFVANFKQ